MKRIAILVALVMVAALVASALTACYVSKPAALKSVVGTYQLINYTHTYSVPKEGSDEKESEVHDLLAERDIEAYLVVRNDGTGYYVYREGENISARSVKINYTYDEDNSDLVKEINYTTGVTTSGDSHPGKGRETLGVYFKGRKKTLSFTMPAISIGALERKYSQSVKYSKVDGATDLSYVQKKMGTTFKVADYAVAELDGVFTYEGIYDGNSDYIYYYVDMRPAEGKADVYYARKADKTSQVLRDQTVRFDVPTLQEGVYETAYINIAVGDATFRSAYYGTPVTSFSHCNADGVEDMWFGRMDRVGTDVPAMIASAMDSYEAFLQQN